MFSPIPVIKILSTLFICDIQSETYLSKLKEEILKIDEKEKIYENQNMKFVISFIETKI